MLRIHAFELGIIAVCAVVAYTALREDKRQEEQHSLFLADYHAQDVQEEPESE